MSKVNARQLEETATNFEYCQKGIPAVCKRDGLEKTDDTYTFGRGYFYRNGMDAEQFANSVAFALAASGYNVKILSKGDHWHEFVGGASRFSSKNSFFWVVCNITKNS